MEKKECCCSCGNGAVSQAIKDTEAVMVYQADKEAASLLSCGKETFEMGQTHRLTGSAAANWELHKEIINAAIEGGWNNTVHPWANDRKDFWRYPLAFSSYGIPSLIMIDNNKYEEGINCLRKSILLFKDIGIWDEWVRCGFGKEPITSKNVMYKGHLNLLYSLYELMTGDDQFEAEFQSLMEVIASEYENNSRNRGFCMIECEPDQCFVPCNSMALMSMLIYDIIYGTDYKEKYVKPAIEFIKRKVTDPETKMPFIRYHPSHDYSEAVITGDGWTLGMCHIMEPEHFEEAFNSYKREFFCDIRKGQACYLKASRDSLGVSTDYEQQTWGYYVPFAAKEYGALELWEKTNRYFRELYGTEIEDGKLKFTAGTKGDETLISCYLFLGDVHQGWQNILEYDWKKFW